MLVNFSQPSSWEFFNDLSAIKEYLGSGLFKGIGKKTASRIFDWFGLDTLLILDSDISRLTEVEGIASYRVGAIQSAWDESKNSPHRAAMSLLLGLGVSLNLSLKICQYYSSSTLDILKSNPYQLALDIDGVGFKTADELALILGITPDSKLRASSGVLHAFVGV